MTRSPASRKAKGTCRPGDGRGCGTKTIALSTMHFIADRFLPENSLTVPAGNAGTTALLRTAGRFRRSRWQCRLERRGRRAGPSAKLLGTSRHARPKPFCSGGENSRLTTQLSDGEMPSQHAGAPALVCAFGSAARGRALYAERRSLQRRVRRRPQTRAPACVGTAFKPGHRLPLGRAGFLTTGHGL